MAAVIDLLARPVVGWAFSAKPDANLVIKALDMAYEQPGRPQSVLFHSDQGSQYGSRSFRQRLWRYRLTQSMSRRGKLSRQCANGKVVSQLENGMGTDRRLYERFAGTVGHRPVLMQRYNWQRPHQFNGGLAPVVVEEKLNAVSGIS